MQINSYHSSMVQYRAKLPRVTDGEATVTTAPSNGSTVMQSLKGLNLSQEQLNGMVSGGRIAGGLGVGGLLLGFLFPPLHFLVGIGFVATMVGFGASVIGDALGGKG
jgi:hypothetical protein